MRCELHDQLGNQCQTESVLIVLAVTGPTMGQEPRKLWGAAACTRHAWEATARAGLRVQRARSENDFDARIVATVDHAGEQLLEALQQGVTVGPRWPLAEPWVA